MVGYARYRRLALGISPTICTVVAVGFLSFLLLIYGERLWRNNFRRVVPFFDNIMHARVSLGEGYLWFDELLKGNEAIQIDTVLRFYDQAVEAVDACLSGKSAIGQLPGLLLTDQELIAQLERFKNSIKRSRDIAEDRWKSREMNGTGETMDRQLHAAFHGMSLMAGVINSTLQRNISKMIERQTTIHSLTLGLWLVILAGVCGALFAAGKRRRRTEEKLRIYQEQLRSLASELVLAEERERRQLAGDLHDSIAQNLAISRIKLEELRSEASCADFAGALDDIRELIIPAIQDARSLIFQLSPPVLYELGLEATIESLAERMQQKHGIVTTMKHDNQPKPLSEDVLVLLFRAVQELLVNVVKHAKAQKVNIFVWRHGDDIRIKVADDGVGFDISAIERQVGTEARFGLFSIRERLHHLGGHLEIVSRPGHGTQVTLEAALSREKKTAKVKSI